MSKFIAVILAFALTALSKTPTTAPTDINQLTNQEVEAKKKKRIVFLISEDPNNYEAHKTIPIFAKMLEKKYGYDVTVLLGSGGHGSYRYPNIDLVSKTDLLVIFTRRIALPHEQMKVIKNYLAKGKPLIGIRTANHAFTANEQILEGFEDWPEFVADVLGCKNLGYGPTEPGTDVSVLPEQISNPIVKDIHPKQWHSNGNIYKVGTLLDTNAEVLLTGKVNDILQPIAWTRTANRQKVFYTSLGYPTDFETPQFLTLLVNAIKWTLDK